MPVASGQAAGLVLESLIRIGLDQVERNSQEETLESLPAAHAGAGQAHNKASSLS